jgi:hypothetical protein
MVSYAATSDRNEVARVLTIYTLVVQHGRVQFIENPIEPLVLMPRATYHVGKGQGDSTDVEDLVHYVFMDYASSLDGLEVERIYVTVGWSQSFVGHDLLSQ